MRRLIHYRTHLCPESPLLFSFALIIILAASCSSSKENRPSPFTTDSTQIGDIKLKIEYSSPRVRERKIFGIGDDYLEQYDEVWRTGANEATVFSTSGDIKLDTFLLPKGKYALFTIPGPKTWEIIINKEWDQWGSYYRKESLDVLRFEVNSENHTTSHENMTFNFEDKKLNFRWEYVGWSVPLNLIE